MTAPRLELQGIVKQYPAVRANDGVSLAVAPGEIHAVLGENGAGKSTLVKIVYGAVQPDAGEMRFDGVPVRLRSPAEARALGIGMVYQHFSLFEAMTVAQNVWLGLRHEKGQTLAQVARRIGEVAAGYGLPIDPARPVHALTVGERQRVEIVRALLAEPRLLILDEPTSVLTPQAVVSLFETLRRLSSQGVSILYISHKLDEIRALCHRCTVLRGGRVTGTVEPRHETNASLARLMIGAEPPPLEHRETKPGAPVLQVRGLSLPARELHGTALHEVSFELRAGEVLGLAGVSGNGQQALMAALAGEDLRAPTGSIVFDGDDVTREGPRQRRQRGLRFVPEERLGRAAVPQLTLAKNLLLTRGDAVTRHGFIARQRLAAQAAALIERFRVAAGGPQAAAGSLSGGNLQKFIVGREVEANPRCLLVSQPTWGVDVGSAARIRAEIVALRDAGAAVMVVSEELDELFEISDRLVVMAQGRLSPSMPVAEANVERIGAWMAGLWPAAA